MRVVWLRLVSTSALLHTASDNRLHTITHWYVCSPLEGEQLVYCAVGSNATRGGARREHTCA